jgi:hypothetical protein
MCLEWNYIQTLKQAACLRAGRDEICSAVHEPSPLFPFFEERE